MQEKRCTACDTPFGCGRDDPTCWCAELPALPAAALDPARDCLCPRCMAERLDETDNATTASIQSRPS